MAGITINGTKYTAATANTWNSSNVLKRLFVGGNVTLPGGSGDYADTARYAVTTNGTTNYIYKKPLGLKTDGPHTARNVKIVYTTQEDPSKTIQSKYWHTTNYRTGSNYTIAEGFRKECLLEGGDIVGVYRTVPNTFILEYCEPTLPNGNKESFVEPRNIGTSNVLFYPTNNQLVAKLKTWEFVGDHNVIALGDVGHIVQRYTNYSSPYWSEIEQTDVARFKPFASGCLNYTYVYPGESFKIINESVYKNPNKDYFYAERSSGCFVTKSDSTAYLSVPTYRITNRSGSTASFELKYCPRFGQCGTASVSTGSTSTISYSSTSYLGIYRGRYGCLAQTSGKIGGSILVSLSVGTVGSGSDNWTHTWSSYMPNGLKVCDLHISEFEGAPDHKITLQVLTNEIMFYYYIPQVFCRLSCDKQEGSAAGITIESARTDGAANAWSNKWYVNQITAQNKNHFKVAFDVGTNTSSSTSTVSGVTGNIGWPNAHSYTQLLPNEEKIIDFKAINAADSSVPRPSITTGRFKYFCLLNWAETRSFTLPLSTYTGLPDCVGVATNASYQPTQFGFKGYREWDSDSDEYWTNWGVYISMIGTSSKTMRYRYRVQGATTWSAEDTVYINKTSSITPETGTITKLIFLTNYGSWSEKSITYEIELYETTNNSSNYDDRINFVNSSTASAKTLYKYVATVKTN